jgi:hypothetical protein
VLRIAILVAALVLFAVIFFTSRRKAAQGRRLGLGRRRTPRRRAGAPSRPCAS